MSDFVDDGPTVTTEKLERMKLVALHYITDALAEQFAIAPKVEISTVGSFLCDEIVLRVVQEVYGHQVESKSVRYPADWWEAFKNHWFPGWALKRWPVQWHTEKLEAWAVYPKLALSDQGARVVIRKSDEGAVYETN